MPVQEESAGFPRWGLVTGSGVNLRSGPGRSYEILLRLVRGSKLQIIGKHQNWLAVSLPEGVPAYLHRSYLAEEEGDWTRVRGDRVQVRVLPSDGSTSWGELSSPDRVQVLGPHGDWVRIEPPVFCRGWVSADYVAYLGESS